MPLYVGSHKLRPIYLNGKKIAKGYLGSVLVYQNKKWVEKTYSLVGASGANFTTDGGNKITFTTATARLSSTIGKWSTCYYYETNRNGGQVRKSASCQRGEQVDGYKGYLTPTSSAQIVSITGTITQNTTTTNYPVSGGTCCSSSKTTSSKTSSSNINLGEFTLSSTSNLFNAYSVNLLVTVREFL